MSLAREEEEDGGLGDDGGYGSDSGVYLPVDPKRSWYPRNMKVDMRRLPVS